MIEFVWQKRKAKAIASEKRYAEYQRQKKKFFKLVSERKMTSDQMNAKLAWYEDNL